MPHAILHPPNRPLARTLIKLAARLVLGSTRGHWHEGWPHLTIRRAEDDRDGEIIWKARSIAPLQPWTILRRRAGLSLVVVGSGPSLTRLDAARLPADGAILVNGAVELLDRGLRGSLAWAVEDERFVWRRFAHLAGRVPPDLPCLFSPAVIRAVCEHDPGWLAGRTVVLIENAEKPYLRPRVARSTLAALPQFAISGDAGLGRDPALGFIPAGTVAFTAAQMALALRPPHLGLAGIDLGNAGEPRFNETGADRAWSGIAAAERRILAHFALLAHIAAETGVAVANHSDVSALARIGLAFDDRFASAQSRS